MSATVPPPPTRAACGCVSTRDDRGEIVMTHVHHHCRRHAILWDIGGFGHHKDVVLEAVATYGWQDVWDVFWGDDSWEAGEARDTLRHHRPEGDL